jgi:hypothetical protein
MNTDEKVHKSHITKLSRDRYFKYRLLYTDFSSKILIMIKNECCCEFKGRFKCHGCRSSINARYNSYDGKPSNIGNPI